METKSVVFRPRVRGIGGRKLLERYHTKAANTGEQVIGELGIKSKSKKSEVQMKEMKECELQAIEGGGNLMDIRRKIKDPSSM